MRDRAIIDTALGWVAADRGIDVEAANRELVQAAARAGVRPVDVARVLLSVFTQSDS
jgi:hypothetical protein